MTKIIPPPLPITIGPNPPLMGSKGPPVTGFWCTKRDSYAAAILVAAPKCKRKRGCLPPPQRSSRCQLKPTDFIPAVAGTYKRRAPATYVVKASSLVQSCTGVSIEPVHTPMKVVDWHQRVPTQCTRAGQAELPTVWSVRLCRPMHSSRGTVADSRCTVCRYPEWLTANQAPHPMQGWRSGQTAYPQGTSRCSPFPVAQWGLHTCPHTVDMVLPTPGQGGRGL